MLNRVSHCTAVSVAEKWPEPLWLPGRCLMRVPESPALLLFGRGSFWRAPIPRGAVNNNMPDDMPVGELFG
jgi:hypothetical protein